MKNEIKLMLAHLHNPQATTQKYIKEKLKIKGSQEFYRRFYRALKTHHLLTTDYPHQLLADDDTSDTVKVSPRDN